MKEPDTRMLGAPVVPDDEASLMSVTAEQSGMLTRAQCLAAGMTDPAIRWRLSRGHWIALHHGVYLTVRGRDDWRTGALAAQLAVDGVVAPDGHVRSRPQRSPAEGDRRGHRRATPDPAATWGRAASRSGGRRRRRSSALAMAD